MILTAAADTGGPQVQTEVKAEKKTTVKFGELCRLAEILMTEKLDVAVNIQPRQRLEEIPMKSCIISEEVLRLVCFAHSELV